MSDLGCDDTVESDVDRRETRAPAAQRAKRHRGAQ
jgi:hypothetical protein